MTPKTTSPIDEPPAAVKPLAVRSLDAQNALSGESTGVLDGAIASSSFSRNAVHDSAKYLRSGAPQTGIACDLSGGAWRAASPLQSERFQRMDLGGHFARLLLAAAAFAAVMSRATIDVVEVSLQRASAGFRRDGPLTPFAAGCRGYASSAHAAEACTSRGPRAPPEPGTLRGAAPFKPSRSPFAIGSIRPA
jgi:hypothetical protein